MSKSSDLNPDRQSESDSMAPSEDDVRIGETVVKEFSLQADGDATKPADAPTDAGVTNSGRQTTTVNAPPDDEDDQAEVEASVSPTFIGPLDASTQDEAQPPAVTVIGSKQTADGSSSEDFGLFVDADESGEPAARVSVAGYEILRELGRGGMGVVYQARQRSLNRVVALKMLLAGAHASGDHLIRFRAEAEAVAQLQHPNIVQVFEVGEQNGLPFFSLEFVDGKSLDAEIDGKPQPGPEAALLTETLARAMQYAHENGILHRDLKPANVLLSADGVPKITDFGLAKRLEGESTATRTGTVMGTPSYMSPEQALGRKDLGPATDIYALGAMLYEFLTGRPPFMGATPMEALMQVLESEPVPPSRLQPKISKDLETICLKCLQKAPEKRYRTATDLADDLGRFQAGKPIHARPVSSVERVWRWCRRNPKISIPTLLAGVLAIAVMVGGPVAAVVISREKALAMQERDRAEENEKQARANEQKAVVAQAAADENAANARRNAARAQKNATQAAEQRSLALRALTTLVTEVQEKLKDTPATHALKQSLLETALKGLREIAASAQKSTIVDGRMAVAHQRMGNVFQVLGQVSDAHAQYERMYNIIKKLTADDKNRARANRNLSIAAGKLGDVCLIQGDKAAARKYYTEALRLRQEWAERIAPTSYSAHVALATSLMQMGEISELKEAEDYFHKARQLRAKLVKVAPKSQRSSRRRDLWIATVRLADTTARQDKHAESRDLCNEALDIAQSLDSDSTGLQSRQDLATTFEMLGNACLRLNEPDDAQRHYAKAVDILRPFAEKDPRNLPLQAKFATMLARQGRHEEAARRADDLRKRSLDNPRYSYVAACCYSLCAESASGNEPGGLRKQYTDKAIASLLQAVKMGYKNLDHLQGDHDLQAVRSLPQFSRVQKAIQAAQSKSTD